jgi:hypothetical protein
MSCENLLLAGFFTSSPFLAIADIFYQDLLEKYLESINLL